MTFDIDLGQAEDDLRGNLREAGLVPPDGLDSSGKLVRIDAADKRGKKTGWLVYHGDGMPAAAFGDWRYPSVKHTWCARKLNTLSDAERAAHLERMKAAQTRRDALQKQIEIEKAKLAAWIWENAPHVVEHPYLTRQKIISYGLRRNRDGRLIVPAYNADGQVSTLQFIDGEKNKRFLKGAKKTGSWFTIGELTETICIAEGYATAASIHAATGYHTAVAFDCGNMLSVAEAIRAKYPAVKIILCADNDAGTEGNPGLTAATRAAKAVRGFLAVPSFGERIPC
jgi:putative DNA primase/helicase